MRGRLSRIIEELLHEEQLRLASLGRYARERMGPRLREAEDLIRLDRKLDSLPCVFRMYAAGRLARSKAW